MRIKLDIPFYLSELLKSISYITKKKNVGEQIITHICTDSRIAQKGDLFLSVRGSRFDGNKFVSEANSIGCISVGEPSSGAHAEVIDSNAAVLQVTGYYKSLFKELRACVAVTGSVGKSSTKEFLKKILSTAGSTHANQGNFNNFIGLAHTVFAMPKETEYLVAELGMNHAGEISKMSACIEPDMSMITNIGTSHIGNFGSKSAIAEAKAEIKDGMKDGKVLIPYGEPLLDGMENSVKVGYNTPSPYSLIYNRDETFTFMHPEGIINDLKIKIGSEHMIKNIAMAITAALLLGISVDNIKYGVSMIDECDIRRRIFEFTGFTIIDDSYNSSYESISADLHFMSNAFADRPLGVFLGDIKELGNMTESIHKEVGRLISDHQISNLYVIGKYAEYIAEGALERGFEKSRIHVNPDYNDQDTSIEQIQSHHMKNEVILFKASHTLRLDLIADAIAAKERMKK